MYALFINSIREGKGKLIAENLKMKTKFIVF